MHHNAFLHRPGNTQQNEDPEEKHQERPHDDRKEPGQKSLYKIHNPYIYLFIILFSQEQI